MIYVVEFSTSKRMRSLVYCHKFLLIDDEEKMKGRNELLF